MGGRRKSFQKQINALELIKVRKIRKHQRIFVGMKHPGIRAAKLPELHPANLPVYGTPRLVRLLQVEKHLGMIKRPQGGTVGMKLLKRNVKLLVIPVVGLKLRGRTELERILFKKLLLLERQNDVLDGTKLRQRLPLQTRL